MRRLFSVFILILFFVLPLCADIVKVGDDKSIYMSVVPYNGSYNINMRADYYPQYKYGQAEPKWKQSSVKMDSKATNSYWDSQMVAAFTIYNIPRTVLYTGSDGVQKSYTIKDDSVYVRFAADCSSGFSFVSQSSPSIVRPFRLYGEAKYVGQNSTVVTASGGTVGEGKSYSANLLFFTPPYDNTWIATDLGSKFLATKNDSSSSYAFWMDVIVSLPFDDGGISQSGVMIGGSQYPLIDANDYSALVFVSGELRIRYYADDGSGDIYDFSYSQTLPIPFSGYSNAISGYEEDKTSVYLNTTTANINLNSDYTGRWISIGTLDFMQNFLSGQSVIQPSKTSGKCADGKVSRIFFSASSDPYSSNPRGFRFIHSNAGNVLTSNNSIPFSLRFEGTGDSSSEGVKYFDGKGYTTQADMINGISGDYVSSYCDNDQYILHTETSKRQMHFHSIQGNLSIMVEDNPDTMQAGTYYADVYVHIIADDLR